MGTQILTTLCKRVKKKKKKKLLVLYSELESQTFIILPQSVTQLSVLYSETGTNITQLLVSTGCHPSA